MGGELIRRYMRFCLQRWLLRKHKLSIDGGYDGDFRGHRLPQFSPPLVPTPFLGLLIQIFHSTVLYLEIYACTFKNTYIVFF